jgi:hypothetical protein
MTEKIVWACRETIGAGLDCGDQIYLGVRGLALSANRSVRIRVRAGDTIICQDGSGVGHGSGGTLGKARESAVKEAETDATKQALITFGKLFGLALYDKAQNGVPQGQESVPIEIPELRRKNGSHANSAHHCPIFAVSRVRAGLAFPCSQDINF